MTTNVLSSAQTITSGRALATPAPSPSGLSVFRSLWALTRRGLTEASLKWFLVIGIALSSFATIFDASKFLSEIDLSNQAAVDSVALRLIRIGFSVLLVSTLWGATQVTTEFRDATVAARVTQHRGVGRLVAGHALASLPAGLLFGLIGALSSTIPTFVIFHQRDLSITMNEDLVSTVVGIIAVSALAAPWGTCFGWLLRRTLPVILRLVAWTTYIEPAIVRALPNDLGQYLPGGLQLTLIKDATAVGDMSAPLAAGLLVAWTVGLSIIATAVTKMGDLRA